MVEQTGDDDMYEQEDKIRYFKWDEGMTKDAQGILDAEKNLVTDMLYRRLEIEAKKHWDIYYKQNTTNGYKDRHYIAREFSELGDALTQAKNSLETTGACEEITLLDLGCGVGNACYPLVRLFGTPPLRVQCCDFSAKAVNFVKEHELYNEEKIDAKTCDLVKEEIPFAPQTASFGILIFVLSAISPENFTLVAKKIYDQLAPGAFFYFRDYGQYDLAQLRLSKRKNQKLKDNFYARANKTRAYYFSLEEIEDLFVNQAGFELVQNHNCYRVVENRKDETVMHRVWVQAKFRKPGPNTNQSTEEKKTDNSTEQKSPEFEEKSEQKSSEDQNQEQQKTIEDNEN